MRTATAFALGVICGKSLVDAAGALASSNTSLGREVRRKLLARYETERLLRNEAEIGEEINRRILQKAEV